MFSGGRGAQRSSPRRPSEVEVVVARREAGVEDVRGRRIHVAVQVWPGLRILQADQVDIGHVDHVVRQPLALHLALPDGVAAAQHQRRDGIVAGEDRHGLVQLRGEVQAARHSGGEGVNVLDHVRQGQVGGGQVGGEARVWPQPVGLAEAQRGRDAGGIGAALQGEGAADGLFGQRSRVVMDAQGPVLDGGQGFYTQRVV